MTMRSKRGDMHSRAWS